MTYFRSTSHISGQHARALVPSGRPGNQNLGVRAPEKMLTRCYIAVTILLLLQCFCQKRKRRIKAKKKENNVGYDCGSIKKKTKGSFHQLLPEFAVHDTVAFKSYMQIDFEHCSNLLIIFGKDFTDRVMKDCVRPAEMCCLAVRLLFSQSVQQH